MPRPSTTALPPSHPVELVRSLFRYQRPPPQRWRFSARAALCMGVPVLAGWAAGDTAAGLMASIGGFTSLYGSGRAYRSRALHLMWIALGLAGTVGLGIVAGGAAWSTVLAVALVAMLATWLCNALQTGPPGAYMFALACAAGTAMPAAHLDAPHAVALVLGGGAFAWAVQMSGALLAPRGPERRAVETAGAAVRDFVDAVGTAGEATARHRAATLLHQAWTVVVAQQPARAREDETVARLRTINRGLHQCFAEAVASAAAGGPAGTGLRDTVAGLQVQARTLDGVGPTARDEVPLGRPGAMAALRTSLGGDGTVRRVVLRVGITAIAVGMLGAATHLERAYWAVAAAVLMLHQGFDWTRMLQRSLQRLLGTWAGLGLAGAILLADPRGPWLALVVMGLQFAVEMLVVRNYALASVFITGAALTIATGGHPVAEPGAYLLARGVDTTVGCAAAVLVYRLLPPPALRIHLPQRFQAVLQATAAVVGLLGRGDATSSDARIARRTLQRATFALAQAYQDGLNASPAQRDAAEQAWPTVAATERLAYRVLAMAWSLEGGGTTTLDRAGATRVQAVLQAVVQAIGGAPAHRPPGDLPAGLAEELDALWTSLVAVATSAAPAGDAKPS